VIIVSTLHRDFLPGSWGFFAPTWVDILQMVGAFGLFFTLLLIFVRVLPMISIAEVKGQHDHHARETGASSGTLAVEPAAGTGDAPLAPVPAAGIVARFRNSPALCAAVKKLREAGYSHIDAHTPFPVHDSFEALGLARSRVPWFTLAGGVTGLIAGLGLMYYVHGIDYPLIVGGKIPGSWQGFVPVAFETTVLLAAFATLGGVLWLCRLPCLHHAWFSAKGFDRTSDDAFFLSVDAGDPQFSPQATGDLLRQLGAVDLTIVGRE
jgi:hypothetical protein